MRRVNKGRFKFSKTKRLVLFCLSFVAMSLYAQQFPYTPGVSYVDTKIEYSYDAGEKVINLDIFWRKGEEYGRLIGSDRVMIANANLRYNIYVEPGVEIPQLTGAGGNVTATKNDEAIFITNVAVNRSAGENLVNKVPDGYTARAFGLAIESNPSWGAYLPGVILMDLPPADGEYLKVASVKIPVISGTPTENTRIVQRSEPYYGLKATDNGTGVLDEGSYWSATIGTVGQGFHPAEWEPDNSNYWVGFPENETADGKFLWSDPTNWSAGELPATGDKVVYRSDANDLWVDVDESISGIDNNGTGKNLIIDTNHSLKITTSDITIADANIIVKSQIKEDNTSVNGTFIVPKDHEIDNAIVEFYTYGVGPDAATTVGDMQWQYFGIPVKTFQANKLQGAYVRRYDETKTVRDTTIISETEKDILIYYWHWLNNSSIMSPVVGYEISRKETRSPYYSFAGELVTSDIDTVLTRTDKAYFEAQHVVSNPYTAGLNIENGIGFGAALESVVYLFHTGTPGDWEDSDGGIIPGIGQGQYLAVPSAQATTLGIDRVASMQGFVVKVRKDAVTPTPADMTLKFKYTEGTVPNIRMRAPSATDKVYSRVNLSSEDKLMDSMWLFTDENSTRGFDNGYDGRKMVASSDLAQIYAAEQDGNYQVNTVPDIQNTYLSFKAQKGVTVYTVSFDHTNLEQKYHALFLTDLKTGVTKDVTANGSSYSFTANNEENVEKRFLLSTIDKSGIDEMKEGRISVYQHDGNIFISNYFNEKVHVDIYNTAGMLMQRFEMKPLSNTSISESRFAQGVYTIRMDVENQNEFSEKVIVK